MTATQTFETQIKVTGSFWSCAEVEVISPKTGNFLFLDKNMVQILVQINQDLAFKLRHDGKRGRNDGQWHTVRLTVENFKEIFRAFQSEVETAKRK